MPDNFIKKVLHSRLFLVISSIFLILAGFGLFKIIVKRVGVNREIANLEQKIKDLEEHNLELTKLVDYFKSDDFEEREARLGLGMKKPDEKVVVLPQPEAISTNNIVAGSWPREAETVPVELTLGQDKFQESKGNVLKWWRYFFDIGGR